MVLSATILTGQWISPTITGSDRPLSISSFSLHLLPKSSNQAIMYGGWIVPETHEAQENSNDTYVLLLTNDTVVSHDLVILFNIIRMSLAHCGRGAIY